MNGNINRVHNSKENPHKKPSNTWDPNYKCYLCCKDCTLSTTVATLLLKLGSVTSLLRILDELGTVKVIFRVKKLS